MNVLILYTKNGLTVNEMKTEFITRFSQYFTGFFVISLCMFLVAPYARAAWNQPTCDPDVDGPTHASCNVSAPINLSTAAQTKAGPLTLGDSLTVVGTTVLENTLAVQQAATAVDLFIDPSIGTGNGEIAIITTSGESLNIDHQDSGTNAIAVVTNSWVNGVQIQQDGAGPGMSVITASGSAPAIFANNTTSSYSIDLSTPAHAAYLSGPGAIGSGSTPITTADGLSVYVDGSYKGIYAVGTSGADGVYTTSDTGVAVHAENTTSGHYTDLGNPSHAAFIQGPAAIGDGAAPITVADALEVFVDGAHTGVNVKGTTGATGVASSTGTGPAGTFSSAVTSPDASVLVSNTAGGIGLRSDSGSVSGSVPVPAASFPTSGSEGVLGLSDSTYGVVGYAESTAGGAGVYGAGNSDMGVVAHSELNYGLYANSADATTYYGGVMCNQTSNCAYLGGPTYSGNFTAKVYMEDQLQNDIVLTVKNTAVSTSSPGYGIVSTVHNIDPATVTAIVADGSAVIGTGDTEHGVFGYSTDNTAVHAISVNEHAVFGSSTGSGGAGVVGTSTFATAGYGGWFTSDGSNSTALLAQNTHTTTSTTDKYGIRVEAGGETATGIQVDMSNKGSGVIIKVDEFGLALHANTGMVIGEAEFIGGQFYPNENSGDGIYQNAYVDAGNTSLGTSNNVDDMLFDGSDVWVLTGDWLYRYNAVDKRKVLDYDFTEITCRTMVLRDETIYILCSSNQIKKVQLRDDTATTTTISGLGQPVSSTHDQYARIWAGNVAGQIGYVNWGGSNFQVVAGGFGRIIDMIFANGFIWAIDKPNGQVIKINIDTMAVDTVISGFEAGSLERMAYDGQYLWIASAANNELIQLHTKTNNFRTFSLASTGLTKPVDVAFDGANIWIIFAGGGGAGGYGTAIFDISKETAKGIGMIPGQIPGGIVFDATYMWTMHIGGELTRRATGSGFGHDATHVSRGLYIYGQDSQLHCIYIDSSGNLQATATLSTCDW